MQYLYWLQLNRHLLPCGDPGNKSTLSSQFSGEQREGTFQLEVLMIMMGKYTVSCGNSKKGTYLKVAGRSRGGTDKRLQKVMIPILL